MASKNLIAINMSGGMDGLNAVSYRDARSVGFIQAARQSAPANILNYAEAPSKVVALTKGSPTFTVSNATDITVGDLCYGDDLPRTRKLTVVSLTPSGADTIVTISGAAFSTVATSTVYFGSTSELFKCNEGTPITVGGTPTNPAFHFNLRWLTDSFSVKPIPANANRTKSAVVSLIGTLIKPVYKASANSGIFGLRLDGFGGTVAAGSKDVPLNLTSHNDQSSTWLANAPEGAIEGWGGGVVDDYLPSISSDILKGLAGISLEAGSPYLAGTSAVPYNISTNSVLLQYPGFTTLAFPGGKEVASVGVVLTDIIKQAAKLDPTDTDNDYHASALRFNTSAETYQPVLKNVPEITSIPTSIAAAVPFLTNLRQILRIMLMNNPNRGFTFERSGNTVTASTAVSNGTATRVAGSTSVKIVSPGHGLFTSNTDSAKLSDSVYITGVDASPPAAGYKITLVPGEEDSAFTITSTANTALTDAPVTLRLKHPFTTENKVFVKDTTLPIDSATAPVDGYQVLSVSADAFSFTFATTDSGAYASANTGFAKLIHLDKQVFYTTTNGFSWDTHNEANTLPLNYLDAGMTYFDSIASRMVNANYVGFTITEFGRTFSTNATGGTDHGWGNSAFVWGKDVKGNAFYGDPIDYDPAGKHVGTNMLIPTTSVYQYGATLAKWMGSTDAQVLELFPKLVNWPVNQRYLGFL